jgi:hypothetical protein
MSTLRCEWICPESNATETAIVEKPAEEDEHAGHHHGHAH